MFNPKQKHLLLSKLGYDGPADEKSMELYVQANPAAASKLGRFESAAKKMMTPPPQLTAMNEGGDVAAPDYSNWQGGSTTVKKNGKFYQKNLDGSYSQAFDTAMDAYNWNKEGLNQAGFTGAYTGGTDYNDYLQSQANLSYRPADEASGTAAGFYSSTTGDDGTVSYNAVGGDTAGGTGGDTTGGATGAVTPRSRVEDIMKASTGAGASADWMDLNGDGEITSQDGLIQGYRDAGLTDEGYEQDLGTAGNPTLLQKTTADVTESIPEIEATTVDQSTPMGETTISKTDLDSINAAQIADGTGDIDTPVEQVTAKTATADLAEEPTVKDAITYDPEMVSGEVAEELEKLKAAQGDLSADATVRGQMSRLMKDFDEGTPPWASGAMRAATQAMASRGLGASSMAGQAIVQAAMESALPIAAQDAKTQAEMEFKNLDNRQQTAIFKTQQKITALLSDQAATNAAKSFNAQSENQVNMFKTQMETQVSQFNAAQVNAISQFNAGQENAISQFNANMKEQREQFNSKNDVLIQQANVQFRNDMFQAKMKVMSSEAVAQAQITSQEGIAKQQIESEEKMKQAAINAEQAMKQAQIAHEATQQQLAREQTAELDALERAFNQEENNKNRALTLLTTTMAAETQKEMAKMASKDSEKAGIGNLIGMAIGLA